MAVYRETPYSAFNFRVVIPDLGGDDRKAGFAEVSGLSVELTVAEYRNGNDAENFVTKVHGTSKAGDVTLKRGIIGDATNVFQWLDDVRNGAANENKRDVTIELLSEDRETVAVSWVLEGAVPIKWTGPSLNAKGGGDVAMEEMVLSVENVTQS